MLAPILPHGWATVMNLSTSHAASASWIERLRPAAEIGSEDAEVVRGRVWAVDGEDVEEEGGS